MYFVESGSVKKFVHSIGSSTHLTSTVRDDEMSIGEFVEAYRSNFKTEYKWHSDRYIAKTKKANDHDSLMTMYGEHTIASENNNELKAIQRLLDQYNQGITVDSLREMRQSYYEWFIKDFDLPPPTGLPLEVPLEMNDLFKN